MFNWKFFENHKNILSQAGPTAYREQWGQHHIDLRPRDLIRWIEFCKKDLGYLTFVDLAAANREQFPARRGYGMELVYLLFNMGSHQRIHLHVHFNAGEVIPSVTEFYTNAAWFEREQAEMLNIRFSRQQESLLLLTGDEFESEWSVPKLPVNPNKSEPPYPEESWKWKSYGLLSPETSGNFEWQVCFDPVKVVQSRCRIGFHHKGIETQLEKQGWIQVLQLVDLVNPSTAPTLSTAWAKNLEEMLRIKLPERAQAIRIVLLELARVAEHLSVLQEMTYVMGKDEHRLFANCREKIHELFEKYCGHRQGLGAIRLGGVREDLPHGWIVEYQTASEVLRKTLKQIHQALTGQRGFRAHLGSAGVSAQDVLKWGVGGPAMRASGLNFDLRKSQPFYFYQDIDFDVPVGIYGTAYDRYLIRYEEIHQSIRIITQVLDNLPLGEWVNPEFSGDFQELEEVLKEIPQTWHYSGLESPNGEAGFLSLFCGQSTPYKVKVKSPSFTLTQALPEFVVGLEEQQLRASLASLGIRRSELDR